MATASLDLSPHDNTVELSKHHDTKQERRKRRGARATQVESNGSEGRVKRLKSTAAPVGNYQDDTLKEGHKEEGRSAGHDDATLDKARKPRERAAKPKSNKFPREKPVKSETDETTASNDPPQYQNIGGQAQTSRHEDHEAMDVDMSPGRYRPSAGKASDLQYPFFTQTVSQYLPLLPLGVIDPVRGYVDQHLEPLLNRYVPSFGGVLLAYRNPRVGEAPGSNSLTQESGMSDLVLLESVSEYAVNFAWLTAEVDLFRPARGAWLEGSVNLQGGGHIGLVCWGMFNASIEAQRLPRGWHWVDTLSSHQEKDKPAAAVDVSSSTPSDGPDGNESRVLTNGYWADEDGARIRSGTQLSFRIKNYGVGDNGDYSYLSIEGTLLEEGDEREKVREEMEATRRLRLRNGGILRKEHKYPPEFSITKFAKEEEQEDKSREKEDESREQENESREQEDESPGEVLEPTHPDSETE
ncbi:Uu.00g095570.m01.CDS01 [Anthostomella pinea]|uniref:DNA-directed RNA polymerase subunit n=1 Tax=Anthostomella pinea TaxID=933095 RepID=A0AAI8V706_9PEZI|nr:Uu.00g095570.m01.CDS01 [Anthostomella pinea]